MLFVPAIRDVRGQMQAWLSSESFFEFKSNLILDTLFLQICMLITKTNRFLGDLTNISAEKLHWCCDGRVSNTVAGDHGDLAAHSNWG